VRAGAPCPSSGLWQCQDSNALEGMRWFAKRDLSTAATFPTGAAQVSHCRPARHSIPAQEHLATRPRTGRPGVRQGLTCTRTDNKSSAPHYSARNNGSGTRPDSTDSEPRRAIPRRILRSRVFSMSAGLTQYSSAGALGSSSENMPAMDAATADVYAHRQQELCAPLFRAE
jgi:hypothetical protein